MVENKDMDPPNYYAPKPACRPFRGEIYRDTSRLALVALLVRCMLIPFVGIGAEGTKEEENLSLNADN